MAVAVYFQYTSVAMPDMYMCVCVRLYVNVHLQLKPAGVSQLVQRVLDSEGNADHWSLKDR